MRAVLLIYIFNIAPVIGGVRMAMAMQVEVEVEEEEDKDWWKYTVIYQVYPQTFMDSDGDGVGDIKELKFMIDVVANHCSDEHPWFQKSIKRIEPYTDYFIWLDPSGYDDDGIPIVPNNWLSIFNGVAWKWNEERHQFFYHQFSDKQPDFNLRNPNVIREIEMEEMRTKENKFDTTEPIFGSHMEEVKDKVDKWRKKCLYVEVAIAYYEQNCIKIYNSDGTENDIKEIIKFWLNQGVDAIRLDATKHFFEDIHFRDEEYWTPSWFGNDNYWHMNHSYTVDQKELYEMIHNLRTFIDKEFNEKVILVSEAYTDIDHTMMYYGRPDYRIVHFPFNFNFIDMDPRPTAYDIEYQIHKWIDNSPKNSVPNWAVENHDNVRIPSRHGPEFSDLFAMLITTLPGVTDLYYGQEIAMHNANLRKDQMRDKQNAGNGDGTKRDAQRTPFQWNNSTNAAGKPWEPQGKDAGFIYILLRVGNLLGQDVFLSICAFYGSEADGGGKRKDNCDGYKSSGFTTSENPWLPVHSNYWEVNLETEKHRERSHYNLMKTLLRIKRTPTAKYGSLETYVFSKWVFVFTRKLENHETYIVIINTGNDYEFLDLRSKLPHVPKYQRVLASSINSDFKQGSYFHSLQGYKNSYVCPFGITDHYLAAVSLLQNH